jgi:hypothetical protein
MSHSLSRRRFLYDTAALAAAAVAVKAADVTAAEAKPADMPKIKLGKLEVSRLILGSNPFWGFAHQPGDVGKQMSAYFTDEKIMEVLDEAAELGVTTVACPPDARWIKIYDAYRARKGKLKAEKFGKFRKFRLHDVIAFQKKASRDEPGGSA